jgi:hypothetical protein
MNGCTPLRKFHIVSKPNTLTPSLLYPIRTLMYESAEMGVLMFPYLILVRTVRVKSPKKRRSDESREINQNRKPETEQTLPEHLSCVVSWIKLVSPGVDLPSKHFLQEVDYLLSPPIDEDGVQQPGITVNNNLSCLRFDRVCSTSRLISSAYPLRKSVEGDVR